MIKFIQDKIKRFGRWFLFAILGGGIALGAGITLASFDLQTATIGEQLQSKSYAEGRVLIADKILSKVSPQTFTSPTYNVRIEIESIKKEEDGLVEVFVRAWRGGVQLGFGKDGTTEYERIRAITPPYKVLSTMADYDYVQTIYDKTDNATTTTYSKDDPKNAFLQDLAHTVSLVVKDGSNIVKGKRGNTVTVCNPDANPETDSVDGKTSREVTSSTWDDAHDGIGTTANDTEGDGGELVVAREIAGDGTRYLITRGFFSCKTDFISSDDITAFVYSFYVTGSFDDDNDGDDFVSIIESTTFDSDTAIGTGDYTKCGSTDDPTELHNVAERKDMTTMGADLNRFYDWTFNSTGRAAINKTGITYLCAREGHDILDNVIANSARNRLLGHMADGTNVPKFTVTHSGGAEVSNSQVYFIGI